VPPVLQIRDLSTRISAGRAVVRAVSDVNLWIDPGETVGLVGESGCGKSMTGLSVMGLLPRGGRVVSGSIKLDGVELVGLGEPGLRAIRGNEIAMIFQDPLSSLDPTKTIGYQVAEPVRLHRGASRKAALDRAADVLAMVGMPRPRERLSDYPHQLSGGQRQRVMIAMALSCEPKVLIADEPTTALDATISAQILDLLEDLKGRLGMSMLLITHDMGVIATRADRVSVMYAGKIVETAPTADLFAGMRHPYARALLASIPRLDQDRGATLRAIAGMPPDLRQPLVGCSFARRCEQATDICRTSEPALVGPTEDHLFACWFPIDGPHGSNGQHASAPLRVRELNLAAGAGPFLEASGMGMPPFLEASGVGKPPFFEASGVGKPPFLEVSSLVKEYPVASLMHRSGSVHAVSDVSFAVARGETFGLVGESGCGKSTVGKMIVALERPTAGTVTLDGASIASLRGSQLRRHRSDLQLMFQDVHSSLDPRMRVGTILSEPMVIAGTASRSQRRKRVLSLLDEIGLPRGAVDRFPHEFSGGQRQRIGLARALTMNPKVIVADEPVSSLDVSVSAQVLNLMKRLQADHELTYVVISHDLTVVKYLADRIGVMYLGKLVEIGASEDVYARPAHPYTAALIGAIAPPEPAARGAQRSGITGELPSPINPPSGCRFRTRCPLAQQICAQQEPRARSFGPGHVAACHFPLRPAAA
jgi:oligopeptide/dipeptide ABC transporter ATP-binding protein